VNAATQAAEGCPVADASPVRTRAIDAVLCGSAALVGFVVFFEVFGLHILDPTNVKWLLISDWGQHFLGWDAFRREPWSWPLGGIQNLNWPEGTSVVYTDSLPILSLPLKPLHAVLPDPFQFQGLWLLTCFMLTPAVGYLLFRHLTGSPLMSASAAAMLPLLPYVLERVGHDSLMAFWLILWAWRLYFSAPSLSAHGWFCCLLLITAAIHAYLLMMVVPIWGTWWLYSQVLPLLRQQNFRALGISAAIMAGQLVLLISLMWAVGYFVIPFSSTFMGGFGYFSMNMNAWFNPAYGLWSYVQWMSSSMPSGRWSIFLPSLPWANVNQYEGFQYPGLGVVSLVLTGLALLLLKRAPTEPHPTTVAHAYTASGWRWLWLPCAFFTAFALSNKITLNGHQLANFDYPFPLSVLAAEFRASGRFFWPVNLILMACALFALTRRLPQRARVGVVGACLLIQLIDIHEAFPSRFEMPRVPEFSPEWNRILDRSAYLGFIPRDGGNLGAMWPLVFMANRRGSRVNTMYMSREDAASLQEANKVLLEQLATGHLSSEASFIIDPKTVCVVGTSLRQRLRVLDNHLVIPANRVGEVGRPAVVGTFCPRTDEQPQ
jgi:Family of unknown function (DUF6311)